HGEAEAANAVRPPGVAAADDRLVAVAQDPTKRIATTTVRAETCSLRKSRKLNESRPVPETLLFTGTRPQSAGVPGRQTTIDPRSRASRGRAEPVRSLPPWRWRTRQKL